MFLFDTDVITNLLKPRPSSVLIRRLDKLERKNQYISTITISEIVYGAINSDRPEYHLNNLEQVLLPAVNIAGFDTKAAYVCGRLRAVLEKQGKPVSICDLETAAIAMSRGFTLVTGNTKHFERIDGLTLSNWMVES